MDGMRLTVINARLDVGSKRIGQVDGESETGMSGRLAKR